MVDLPRMDVWELLFNSVQEDGFYQLEEEFVDAAADVELSSVADSA